MHFVGAIGALDGKGDVLIFRAIVRFEIKGEGLALIVFFESGRAIYFECAVLSDDGPIQECSCSIGSCR